MENNEKMNISFEKMVEELVVKTVSKQLDVIAATVHEKEIMTAEEAAQFLGLAKSYLYKLTSAGLIPYYKPAGKVIYFEKSVLIEWIRQHPGKSAKDLAINANNYTATHPLYK